MTSAALKLRAENNILALSDTEQKTVRCMVCSSVEEARHYSRSLATPGERQLRMLEVALDYEKAHASRSTVLTLLRSALKKAALPTSTALAIATAPSSKTEVVSAITMRDVDLRNIATAIESSIDIVSGHEGAFEEATLEHRLEIGLHVSRAQEIFTASVPNPKGKNQHSEEVVSQRDITSPDPTGNPLGFAVWLIKNVPRLKRPTAYKYATAFRSLGLATTAKPIEIRSKLKDLRHQAGKAKLPMPTLAGLVKAAPKPPKTALIITRPKESKQLRIEDAREMVAAWQDAWRALVKAGHLDNLPGDEIPALLEFIAFCRDGAKKRLPSKSKS